jgi:tRNA (cytidine/uridine-2'-O-)-methyltransferase
MFNVVLFEPEIPPNTGNIIRLCANTGSQLHLIKPLAFEPDDKQLRRAGLDYGDWLKVQMYDGFADFVGQHKDKRIYACSTKGKVQYDQVQYQAGDVLLMGPETRGLPAEILSHSAVREVIRIPMVPNNRSLNLSNATAVILYEAWRQQKFKE